MKIKESDIDITPERYMEAKEEAEATGVDTSIVVMRWFQRGLLSLTEEASDRIGAKSRARGFKVYGRPDS